MGRRRPVRIQTQQMGNNEKTVPGDESGGHLEEKSGGCRGPRTASHRRLEAQVGSSQDGALLVACCHLTSVLHVSLDLPKCKVKPEIYSSSFFFSTRAPPF